MQRVETILFHPDPPAEIKGRDPNLEPCSPQGLGRKAAFVSKFGFTPPCPTATVGIHGNAATTVCISLDVIRARCHAPPPFCTLDIPAGVPPLRRGSPTCSTAQETFVSGLSAPPSGLPDTLASLGRGLITSAASTASLVHADDQRERNSLLTGPFLFKHLSFHPHICPEGKTFL